MIFSKSLVRYSEVIFMNTETFFKITYGLYLVSSVKNGKYNAHVSNTVFQVSAEPPLFAICSNKNNLTTEYMEESGVVGVSIIQEDVDLQFIGKFGFKSGRDSDKFVDTNFLIGKTGAPLITDKAIAYLDCQIESVADLGTHKLFIVKVLDAQTLKEGLAPLTYRYYREVIKGISPKNAPTYHAPKVEVKTTEEKPMKKWRCELCGYEYDPAHGDKEHGIAPGVDFDDLPDDWHCPVCGVDKSSFVPMG